MIAVMNSLYHRISYLLSPPSCFFCKKNLKQRTVFCTACQEQIRPVVSCPLVISSHMTMNVLSVSGYCDPLKKLIIAKSWSDRMASRQLGEIIWERSLVKQVSFDYIVPIPLHWSRYAFRGYNQAQEIADVIARKSGKPVANILHRTRRTAFQSFMTFAQRTENVKSAFTCTVNQHQNQYYEKKFLLVDDVMTSGATLITAAKTLMKLRPTVVTAVVGCRVIR